MLPIRKILICCEWCSDGETMLTNDFGCTLWGWKACPICGQGREPISSDLSLFTFCSRNPWNFWNFWIRSKSGPSLVLWQPWRLMTTSDFFGKAKRFWVQIHGDVSIPVRRYSIIDICQAAMATQVKGWDDQSEMRKWHELLLDIYQYLPRTCKQYHQVSGLARISTNINIILFTLI